MPVPRIYIGLSPALLPAIVVGLLGGAAGEAGCPRHSDRPGGDRRPRPVLCFGFMFVVLGLPPFGPWEYDGDFLSLFMFLQLISAPAGLLSALGAVA